MICLMCLQMHKTNHPSIFDFDVDGLACLNNKSIFFLLDLKDGFHQIKLHPNHSKYFLFATPDGQFEYTRLPFGYCEAEFQKCLIQIFQSLIGNDKVLVYIDGILIPSSTIEENLNILGTTFMLFKRYQFQLNYKKCQFFKTKLKYQLYYFITRYHS